MRYSYFQSLDHLVRRRALREEWLEGVEGEGEGDDGDGGRHDDDALHPHPVRGNSGNGIRISPAPDESWKPAESDHDVGIVRPCETFPVAESLTRSPDFLIIQPSSAKQ